MDQAEYIALKQAIQEDCRKQIEALDLVYELSKKYRPHAAPSGAPEGTSLQNAERSTESTDKSRQLEAAVEQIARTFGPSRERLRNAAPEERSSSPNGTPDEPFRLKEAIKAAIEEVPDVKAFGQRHITLRIRRKHPGQRVYPGSVSSALSRMAKQGEIRVVKPAFGGSNPAYYGKVPKEEPVSPQ